MHAVTYITETAQNGGKEYCCVPCCNSDAKYASGKDKTFHHFPKDPARKSYAL